MHFRFCCVLTQMKLQSLAAKPSDIFMDIAPPALMSDRQKLCKHAYMEACSLCRFGADFEIYSHLQPEATCPLHSWLLMSEDVLLYHYTQAFRVK